MYQEERGIVAWAVALINILKLSNKCEKMMCSSGVAGPGATINVIHRDRHYRLKVVVVFLCNSSIVPLS